MRARLAPFTRFDFIVWGLAAALLLFIGGMLLAQQLQGIQVTAYSPQPDRQAGALGPVRLTFAQPIRAGSVEAHFTLEGLPGHSLWQGDTFVFIPDQPLEIGRTYTARLDAGVTAEDGRQLKEPLSWSFSVRSPGVVFVRAAEGGAELYHYDVESGESRPLTDTGGRVFDYAVSPFGDQIIYSTGNDQGGADLWLIDRTGSNARVFQLCVADRCYTPAWSPDATQIAFSRASAGLGPDEPLGPPRVMLADPISGDAARLFADTSKLGYGPRFSPDGSRIAMWDGVEGHLLILHLDTREEIALSTQSGQVGAWSPDGTQMLFADTRTLDGLPVNSVFLADFATHDVILLLREGSDDSQYFSPSWSPDGHWITAKVRLPGQTIQEAMWLMPPDGGYALVIDDQDSHTYLNATWDPWSTALLYQKIALGVSFPEPEIWLYTLETGSSRPLIINGSDPQWLP